MATNSSAIQKKIETLKKGLNNKFITASQKEKIKAQVEKLESQSKALAPKKSTKTATSSSLTRLQKLVKNKKYSVYKGTGVDLKKDSDRPAKAIGKRTSKSGKTYYEYRANRIDVKQPPKKYPKLEKGGYMADGGEANGWKKGVTIKRDSKKEAENNLKLLQEYYGKSGKNFKVEKRDDKYVVTYEFNLTDKMAKGGISEKEVVESNAEMVLSQIKAVKHHAEELSRVVSTKSNIEAWVVGKIERASTDLSDITHYLEGNKDKMSMGGTVRYYAHKMDKK